ncbi:MAG: outer membrane protein assembly factor BamD [Gemmatimonadota bacterium]
MGMRAVFGLLLACVIVACSSSPPYAGVSDDEIVEHGLAAYEAEDWDEVVESLGRVVLAVPNHPRGAEVRLALAEAYFEREEYLSAAAEFEMFLARYPSDGRAPNASIGICRSYAELSPHPQRDAEYTRRARDTCRNTVLDFQGTNIAEEAERIRVEMVEKLAQKEYEEGRFYERRDLYDSAILYYQDLVEQYPGTSWAPRGWAALYRTYQIIGWTEEAEEARSTLLSLYPNSPEAAELRAEDDG